MEKQYHWLFIAILVALVCLNLNTVHTQTLPQDEYDSLLWLIRHYGLDSIPQTQPSICDSSHGIECGPTAFDNGYHVLSIYFQGIYGGTNCSVPPPITSLSFPAIETFSVHNPRYYYDTTNPISLLRNAPNLTTLNFDTDLSVTSIPADFPPANMTKLRYVTAYTCPLVSVPTFFNNSNVGWFVNTGTTIKDIKIDQYTNLPEMWNFALELSPSTPITMQITKKSFPSLVRIDMRSNGTERVKIYYNTTDCSSMSFMTATNSGFDLIIQNSTNLETLTLEGNSTIYPPFNTFIDLKYLYLTTSTLSQYPFTAFPPNIIELYLDASLFTNIPSLQIPKQMRYLSMIYNKLTGPLNWGVFDIVDPGFALYLENNVGLTGAVPELFCQHYLYSYNTSLSSYPDCYYCYYDNTSSIVPIVKPPIGFTCNITIDSFNLLSFQSYANITGNNLGWGFNIGLSAIIPNKIIQVRVETPYYTPTNYSISLGYNSYLNIDHVFNFTVVEVGIGFNLNQSYQVTNGIQMDLIINYFNPNLNHTFTLNNSVPLYLVSNTSTGVTIKSNQTIPSGSYQLTVSNQYTTYNGLLFDFFVVYPIIQNITLNDSIVQYGSKISIDGDFGTLYGSPTVRLNQTDCVVTFINQVNIICEIQTIINVGIYDVTVIVDGYSYQKPKSLTIVSTLQSICMYETNNCNNGGQCDINGICVCNPGFYMNNCIKPYPSVSSGQYDPNDFKIISLYGDFGPNGQINPTAQVNGVNCSITFIDQSLINCTLPTNPNYGLVPVKVIVDGLIFNRPDVINFISPNGTTPSQQECQKSSPPCFGHGQCGSNGECICIDGYNQDDNCLTKYYNGSNVQVNTTTPTASFDIDGISFGFIIKSIQEISINNTIMKELIVNNWIANVTNTPTITNGIYQLNITNHLFLATNVTAMISFSNLSRDIEFGNQILHINPNSIKISLNITNWIFSSNLATLRVVFSTTINNQQSIQVDCEQQDIPTFINDQQTQSLQYFRVVKDNIQFGGRFIDYVMSDGRPTFSRTQLINRTKINDDISNAFIGITLPQCRECILDPDFTPLLIDKSEINNDNCNDSKSNTWRVVVGVVIGVVAAVGISIATVLYLRKKKRDKKFNKMIQHKLAKIN